MTHSLFATSPTLELKKIKLKIGSIQISPFQKLQHSGDVTTSLSQSVFLLLVATWIAKFAVQRQL